MPDHKPLIGISLMVVSAAFLAGKDGLAKTFLDQVGPMQMIWIQFTATFLILGAAALPFMGRRTLQPTPLAGQFVRGALNAGAVVMLYWGLSYIPLADAIAMFMLAPIVVTLVAPFMLGETIGNRRKLAVAVGFAGAVVILKPGFGGQAFGYYLALVAGILMGLNYLANRRLAGAQAPILNIAHNALMGSLAMTPFLPWFWQPVPPEAIPKLIGLVALAVIGQGFMIWSFNFGPAPVIAPYAYTMLVFAAIIGYLAFGTFPDVFAMTGIIMIVGAGLYIAMRERQISAGRS